MALSKSEKEKIVQDVKEVASNEGFRTMQDMGRELILTGDLNFREFDRVLSGE